MSQNYFSIGGTYDPDMLATAVEYESVQGGFWTRFLRENYVPAMGYESTPPIGSVERQGDQVSLKGGNSGAPIETMSHFENGGTTAKIPLRQRYIGMPRSGRSAMQGTGEGVRWLWRTVTIWNLKKVFRLLADGPDEQTLRDAMKNEINGNVKKAAGEWLRDFDEGNIPHAILTGYSAELTNLAGILDARSDNVPFSHGNFFVAGSGRVPIGTGTTGRPTSAEYEDAAVAALNTMLGKPAADVGMTVKRLVGFRDEMQKLNIPKVQTPYGPLYLVAMKSSAFRQLTEDPVYQRRVIDALPRSLKDNPVFAGAMSIIEHCLIFVEPTLFGIQRSGTSVVRHSSSTLGMPAYGPPGNWMGKTGQAESFDTNDIALTYGIGANMLSKVYGRQRIKWSEEEWDHEQQRELGMKLWKSLIRNDKIDIDGHMGYGENGWAYNDSSAIMATFSPYESEI